MKSGRDRVDALDPDVAGCILEPVAFPSVREVMTTLDQYWTRVELP